MGSVNNIHRNALKPGHKILWYEIKEVLGQGGFGITYLAHDPNLDKYVAIKEYLPIELAVRDTDSAVYPITADYNEQYQWGLSRFINEARTIAQFNHPNIVRVHSVTEENNTAYMVMSYENGQCLQKILDMKKILDEENLLNILIGLLDGLRLIHNSGFIHRDIKPDNIFIRNDGSPLLLDFGSARQALAEKSKSITSVVSPGYAPFEQYQNDPSSQGPWTDIYALGATLYRCIYGRAPADALNRSNAIVKSGKDSYVAAIELGSDRYSLPFLQCIDSALNFDKNKRPQNVNQWLSICRTILTDKDNSTYVHTANKSILRNKIRKRVTLGLLGLVCISIISFFLHSFYLDYKYHKQAFENYEYGRYFQAAPSLNKLSDSGDAEASFLLALMHFEGKGMPYNTEIALKVINDNEAKIIDAADGGKAWALTDLSLMHAFGWSVEHNPNEAVRLIRLALKQNYSRAYHAIANYYYSGIGLDKNPYEAAKWFQKAADMGLSQSLVQIAFIYFQGNGLPQDSKKALSLLEKAAAQGSEEAFTTLGANYFYGMYVNKNHESAYKWLSKANENNSVSQYMLGIMYMDEAWDKHDIVKGISLIKKSAGQNYNLAQSTLGILYHEGKYVEKDLKLSHGLHLKAANNGNVDSQYFVGLNYLYGFDVDKDEKLALLWLDKAAKQSDPRAEYQISILYIYGDNYSQADKASAVELLKNSANKGYPDSQRLLAAFYYDGFQVNKNLNESVRLFKLSAENGNAQAQAMYGRLLMMGDGVEKNAEEARQWLIKSMTQDNSEAVVYLGLMYERGYGTPLNLKTAYDFYQKAADMGNTDAKNMADKVKKLLENKSELESINYLFVKGVYTGSWTSTQYNQVGNVNLTIDINTNVLTGKLDLINPNGDYTGEDVVGYIADIGNGKYSLNIFGTKTNIEFAAVYYSNEITGNWKITLNGQTDLGTATLKK